MEIKGSCNKIYVYCLINDCSDCTDMITSLKLFSFFNLTQDKKFAKRNKERALSKCNVQLYNIVFGSFGMFYEGTNQYQSQ